MKRNKAKAAAIVLAIATAIALTGTFAWQSISQMALNEASELTNPGGRLHDDFSGYEADDTKDIYVENFGNEVIYARIRLDEYMEIGKGAGLKGTVGEGGAITPNPDNHAVPLVTGAKIDDLSTWTTHIPGNTAATTGVGAEAPTWTDPAKTFHTFWTWTMGGQAEDNAEGKTVYMPTFNKNKDSLKADINGTMAGKDKDPATGDPYDDYVKYNGTETATHVRDTDATYNGGAAYDADMNSDDECGPYGGPGGAGAEGDNYEMKAETHKAQETMGASVITMGEYDPMTDAQKLAFVGWVYDVDGWAYWSQPIEPGTPTETNQFVTNATGLLLDRVYLEHEPSDAWYYSINAVAQFITADDLGRTDDPKTGFYDPNGGPVPTDEALDLLDGIGVNTAGVKGSIIVSASVTVDDVVKPMGCAVPGMDIDLSAVVTVADVAAPVQDVEWTVTGNTDPATTIDTSSGKPVLKVGPNETAGGALTITAASTNPDYDRLKGKLKLPVEERTYTVTLIPDGGATGILPGGALGFTAVLTSNDPTLTLPQNFTWALDTSDRTYATGTAVTPADDTGKATLNAAGGETGVIKLTATPADTAAYPGVIGTATIPVTAVTYTVNIKDSAEPANTVTGTTVEVGVGGSADFTVDVTSTPPGATTTDNWTWTSSNTAGGITVDENGRVTIAAGTAANTKATITATNSDYDPTLTASFTVNAHAVTYEVTITPETSTVYTGKTQEFTVSVTASEGADPADVVEWSISGSADATNTKFDGNTLTVGDGEAWGSTLTITATHASGATATATVTVGTPTFTVNIKDSAETPNIVTNQTVRILQNTYDTAFTIDVTSDPAGYTPPGDWEWTTSDPEEYIYPNYYSNTTTAEAVVDCSTVVGSTATITATNKEDSSLTASFTVEAADWWEPEGKMMQVDGIDFCVAVDDATITGTDGRQHKAKLLIAKGTYGEPMAFGTSSKWPESAVRTMLNGSFLDDHPTIKSKAIEVPIKTRATWEDSSDANMQTSNDKVFILAMYDFTIDSFVVKPNLSECTYDRKVLKPYLGRTCVCLLPNTEVDTWVRSCGRDYADKPSAQVRGSEGGYTLANVDQQLGVRPAFWYSLDP